MKDSFKSSSVIGLNWIYESDSLPESTSWKMSPVDKWKWAFERSRDSVSVQLGDRLFFPPATCPSIIFLLAQKSSSNLRVPLKESKVFDVLSGCKDKAACLAHSAAASRKKKKKFLILFVGVCSWWHWPFQYLVTTTLPVWQVPIDGWCEAAIRQPIPQPQITVPACGNHNVEKGLIAHHPTYKVWHKWVFQWFCSRLVVCDHSALELSETKWQALSNHVNAKEMQKCTWAKTHKLGRGGVARSK